jgi:two-component system sensor histidine kinase KdpD
MFTLRSISKSRKFSLSRKALDEKKQSPWAAVAFSRSLMQILGVIGAVAVVTTIDFRLAHVNSATAAFTYLILILGLATRVGLRESITASIVSVATYNFFFLPPVGTFTISDPQNWVALFAFLATAITASHLSSSARRKAEEAHARQEELQRMYDFSRGLILGKEEGSLADQIVRQIVESFGVESAWFYDSKTDLISKIEGIEPLGQNPPLREVSATGRVWRNAGQTVLLVPVRLGGMQLGSLGMGGAVILSEVAMQALAQLIAIAIERARAQQDAARLEATRQNEHLKSTLLDALAHEFKTPLTSVKAATTSLLTSPALSAFEKRELLTIVDEEADRMTKLVSDSIELARMGTAPLTLQPEICSPEQLLFSALEDLHGLFEGRNLKVTISPDLPTVLADRALSELALRQILNNALKYSPADSEIRVSAGRQDCFVVVCVSDTGPGIAKSEQERIFEKFHRGRNVRTRVPGTGMGLHISREIIEAQGGRVEVQSEIGQGATFSLTLPIHACSGTSNEGKHSSNP